MALLSRALPLPSTAIWNSFHSKALAQAAQHIGDVAQMVEHSLSMRGVQGSIPCFSTSFNVPTNGNLENKGRLSIKFIGGLDTGCRQRSRKSIKIVSAFFKGGAE
ncbi:hypothetical protein PROFUN_06952 [Planoprotostelium fungivorum]|uniref:Uncharacterized protein n=1 Tax=Planoprotostelium fungivorum TaxID=1890364 RepID=A0A2P6NN87_9EUKA|nr:hypothetical protein PROFUN_06952 [Planoprotostelium fungivorum]